MARPKLIIVSLILSVIASFTALMLQGFEAAGRDGLHDFVTKAKLLASKVQKNLDRDI